jgi:hypothetical protein
LRTIRASIPTHPGPRNHPLIASLTGRDHRLLLDLLLSHIFPALLATALLVQPQKLIRHLLLLCLILPRTRLLPPIRLEHIPDRRFVAERICLTNLFGPQDRFVELYSQLLFVL